MIPGSARKVAVGFATRSSAVRRGRPVPVAEVPASRVCRSGKDSGTGSRRCRSCQRASFLWFRRSSERSSNASGRRSSVAHCRRRPPPIPCRSCWHAPSDDSPDRQTRHARAAGRSSSLTQSPSICRRASSRRSRMLSTSADAIDRGARWSGCARRTGSSFSGLPIRKNSGTGSRRCRSCERALVRAAARRSTPMACDPPMRAIDGSVKWARATAATSDGSLICAWEGGCPRTRQLHTARAGQGSKLIRRRTRWSKCQASSALREAVALAFRELGGRVGIRRRSRAPGTASAYDCRRQATSSMR